MPFAMRVHQPGGPEAMQWEEVEVGDPGPGEIRLRHTAVGLNYIDVYFRTGLYPRPVPFVAGLEGAGVIAIVGSDVRGFRVGDRVAWASVPGSYADAVIAPASSVVAIPDPVSEETAAAATHAVAHLVACFNAGDLLAGWGGVSDDFLTSQMDTSIFDEDFAVYTIWTVPDSGLVVEFSVPAGPPTWEFLIADRSYDLPDVALALRDARPSTAVPIGGGDGTIVWRRVTIPLRNRSGGGRIRSPPPRD